MTIAQFNQAVKLAANGHTTSWAELGLFDGFALRDFKPIYCRLEDLAGLIVWQALQFNGQFDQEALNTIKVFGKSRFMIV